MKRSDENQKNPQHLKNKQLRVVNMYKDDWWLEHLEDEHEQEPNLRDDLKLLLKNSKSDRSTLESLRKTRQAIKAADDVVMPESGFVYQDLHDRIMSAIEKEEDAKSPRSARNNGRNGMTAKRSNWAVVFGSFSLTTMMALVTFFVLKQSGVMSSRSASGVRLSLAATESALDARTALQDESWMDVGSETEMITQAAAEKLDHMSMSDAKAILASLRNN